MLPDFPALKAQLMKQHMRKFQADMDAQMPIVSQIRSVRFHEGKAFSFERSDGVVEIQEFLDVKKPVQISARLEFDETVHELKQQMKSLEGVMKLRF
jgi:hypothetical protein